MQQAKADNKMLQWLPTLVKDDSTASSPPSSFAPSYLNLQMNEGEILQLAQLEHQLQHHLRPLIAIE